MDQAIQDRYHASFVDFRLVDWFVNSSNGSLHFDDRQPRGSIAPIDLPRE